MNTLHSQHATLDDMVFEGRNKAYGAFILRQSYNQHLTRAACIAFSLFLLLVNIPLIIGKIWPDLTITPSLPVINDEVLTLTKIDLTKGALAVAPPAPVVVTPPRPVESILRIVADNKIQDLPKEEPTNVAPNSGSLGTLALPGVIGGIATGSDTNATGTVGVGSTDSGNTATKASAQPFSYVEVMPEFAGGQEALRKFMQRNLHYPAQALSNSVAGKVLVSFVVNTDGSISNVEVTKGLGFGTDEEAARVVRKMPSWTPGRQNNRAVPVRYTLPITFRYE